VIYAPPPQDLLPRLDRPIRVMVVDDEPDEAAFGLLLDNYRLNPAFDVAGLRAAEEAEQALLSGPLPDVCQIDFGLKHPRGDQFHLVRRFGAHLPFVGFTGRSRVAMNAADFMLAGGRYVFDKGEITMDHLQERAFLWGTVRILLREHWLDTFLLKSMDVLYVHEPQDVNAWSLAMPRAATSEPGYDPSYLRRKWSAVGVPPKDALFLFHLYNAYFRCGSGAAQREDPVLRRRLDGLLDIYHGRRSAMLAYLVGPRAPTAADDPGISPDMPVN
jgi:hypothetical protein